MMNNFKRFSILFLILCVSLIFISCSNDNSPRHERVEGFEFHFFPEDYAEEYNNVIETFPLEADTDYELKIDATCESGSIEIHICSENQDKRLYIVNENEPCSEAIVIPANQCSELELSIFIVPETKGDFIGSLNKCPA